MPLRKREPVRPVPKRSSASLGGGLHARVASQSEVVVRAEHDVLVALHLDHRTGGALEHPEVGHQVVVASSLQLLQPLVAASLLE